MQRGGTKGAEDRSVFFCPAPQAQMNSHILKIFEKIIPKNVKKSIIFRVQSTQGQSDKLTEGVGNGTTNPAIRR